MRENRKAQPNLALAALAGSALWALCFPMLAGAAYSRRSLSDGLTTAGLVLLIAGLWRVVGRLGMFDSTKYGWKKFVEVIRTKNYVHSRSELPSLVDYKRKNPYRKTYLPLLAVAALDLAAAALIA